MVLIPLVRDYIDRMLHDIPGMKVLVLDPQSVGMVSVVYSQSDLLRKEVFLVETVDNASSSRESMAHLKAVYFLRPSSDNVQKLRRHLAAPRFAEYHLFFSNILKIPQIQVLADSDEQEVVQQVQEFYADFCAIDPYHFTLNIQNNHMYMLPTLVGPPGIQSFCDRAVDGIASVFLALKRRPIIRYQRASDAAKRIAQETARLMYDQESGLFDFRRTENSSLLLVIDRRDDPVTPLLNQWTYQEVVLSSIHDDFFRVNMFENFGDLGMNIKRMVDDFQHLSKSSLNLQSIGDMAKFVTNYPEYRKAHGNVTKHVALVSEMSRIVEERKLMLVSQTEQELACTSGQAAAFEAVTSLLNNESVSDIDRLRLVMLYALRYEKESPVQLMQLFNKLASRSAKYKSGLVQFLLKQAGVDKRTCDLYGNRDLLNIARNMARGLKGVENVYTQHQPLLFQTMEGIMKGRLRDADYPLVGNHFQQGRPQDVVIFIVGGTTYEEARSVALFNTANPGVRFFLGGSAVLNSKRFLEDLGEAQRISKSSTLV
ncbi:vacuolar protein sorting-associated protein 45 homolog isoform X2 [Phragmites australis]|uniref:vacuolar protein sorting-associated protein 45 homolog isoform X2 n=1 Tax=Phragmites australis TaxID=29695 RepID=UPI002D76FBE6|nr:vacuolar protein sorting-associated protein 45 homolog isoform X2 [Phragmites australis]